MGVCGLRAASARRPRGSLIESDRSNVFRRIISIDWSGAQTDAKPVHLRIATYDADVQECTVVRPQGTRAGKNWSRHACRLWLRDRLAEPTPVLVAMDFGFGYPWGTDQAVFGVQGWHALIDELRQRHESAGTARAAAQAINQLPGFGDHGPFRFDESRTDFRFYLDNGVAYYRLADLMAPQAISQWYLGSGGTVGFHSITGLAAISWLIEERRKGTIDFEVWPHEVWEPRGEKHVLVESYPALYPRLSDYGPCTDVHEKDAWRALAFLQRHHSAGTLSQLFRIPELSCGRVDGVDLRTQVQFEGFILGLV